MDDPDWNWILDKLEDQPFGTFHMGAGLAGLATTVTVGFGHLLHPEVLGRLYYWNNAGSFLVLILGVAPAFAAALAFGQLLNRTAGGSVPDRSGPMSGYMLQQRESRKWKLRVAAAAVGAANFLFLSFTAVPPPNTFQDLMSKPPAQEGADWMIQARDKVRIETPGVEQQPLHNAPLAQFPGKQITAFIGEVQPGAKTPWHGHPATEMLFVLEGVEQASVTGRAEGRGTVRTGAQ